MKNNESKLQRGCVTWFRLQYQELIDLFWATPNGGKRNKITAANLKAEGVSPGVPDLFLAFPSNGYHGLFVEMKYGRNKLTPEQARKIDRLITVGYKCEVCYSFDQFQNIVRNYLTSEPIC